MKADIFLELEELNYCDIKTGVIGVDKQIFDDYVEGAYINISFIDAKYSDEVYEYVMVQDTADTIYLIPIDNYDSTISYNFEEDTPSISYIAYIYNDDGTVADESEYDTADEAIAFAKNRGWDEVLSSLDGNQIWHK